MCYLALGAAGPDFVKAVKHGHLLRTAACAAIMIAILVSLYRFAPSKLLSKLRLQSSETNSWIAAAIFVPLLCAFYGVLWTGSWIGAFAVLFGIVVIFVAAVATMLIRGIG